MPIYRNGFSVTENKKMPIEIGLSQVFKKYLNVKVIAKGFLKRGFSLNACIFNSMNHNIIHLRKQLSPSLGINLVEEKHILLKISKVTLCL